MVSDAELLTRLQEIVRKSDLETASVGSIRRQLEKEFQVDLSDRKSFIRDQVDILLQQLANEGGEKKEECAAENADDENDDVEPVAEDTDKEEEESKSEVSSSVDQIVKKRRGGFNKLSSLSPQLQKFVGVSKLARTEVVKKIWAYIRENNLQNPEDKRKIICDESLQALFHVKSIDMFKMNKALSKHIWPLSKEDEGEGSHESAAEDVDKQEEEDEEEEKEGEEEEVEEEEEEEDNDEQEEEEEEEDEQEKEKSSKQRRKKKESVRSTVVDKDVKKRGNGFTKPCSLSPELQSLLGVSELARTQVVKKLWEYIRKNNLQDPKNKQKIICDESLHALFRVDSINMFQMNKALTKHIWPLNEDNGADDPTRKGKRQKK